MLTDAQIQTAYQGIIRRAASMAEIALHKAMHPDVSALISNLKASTTNVNHVMPAIRAFQWMLGRKPDSAGLNYWAGLLAGGGSTASIYAAFLGTPEAQSVYPNSATNSTFVTTCYNKIFGRAPDSAGLNYWVGQLNSGVSRDNVLLQLGESAEAKDRIAPKISAWQDQAGNGATNIYSGSFF